MLYSVISFLDNGFYCFLNFWSCKNTFSRLASSSKFALLCMHELHMRLCLALSRHLFRAIFFWAVHCDCFCSLTGEIYLITKAHRGERWKNGLVMSNAEEKRRGRKMKQHEGHKDSTFICPTCGKDCYSRIGLSSHNGRCFQPAIPQSGKTDRCHYYRSRWSIGHWQHLFTCCLEVVNVSVTNSFSPMSIPVASGWGWSCLSGLYPLTCSAWVFLPGAEAPAGKALRVLKARKPPPPPPPRQGKTHGGRTG